MSQTYSVKQSARDPVLLRTPVHNFQEDRVKQEFSIKDLENLSGVKAHTIRVWEQRYSLLSPTRSATNIRTYSGNDLKKIAERGVAARPRFEDFQDCRDGTSPNFGSSAGWAFRPRRRRGAVGKAAIEGGHDDVRRGAFPHNVGRMQRSFGLCNHSVEWCVFPSSQMWGSCG